MSGLMMNVFERLSLAYAIASPWLDVDFDRREISTRNNVEYAYIKDKGRDVSYSAGKHHVFGKKL